MAEVLIPEAMVVVIGITKVSPTAQVEELTLPMVAVMFWARSPGKKPKMDRANPKRSALALNLDVFMVTRRLFCMLRTDNLS